MPRAYKPEGYNDLSPYLIVEHAGQLIDFLTAAFAAEILRVYADDEGAILHAEMRIGDSVMMLANSNPDWPAIQATLHLYVPDADAVYKQALAAGGTSVQAPSEREGDPDRRGTVQDPFGNTWSLGTQLNP
jgi:uncharacterized glyoxalase superfamily protein PhnB